MFKSSKVKKASSLVIMAAIAARPSTHMACRSFDPTNLQAYQVGKDEKLIIRPFIPIEKVSWNVDYLDYKPINYTSPIVMANPPWADPVLPPPDTKWNSFDGKIDRRSHFSKYEIVNGLPRNPVGRTGITGRGLLGRWGPNHAADPIVTRWKLDKNGSVERDLTNNKPILQFVAIQRVDTNEWAIPGGMCDPGEKISNTMKREFMEEALNSEKMDNDELNEYKKKLENLFKDGIEVYRGYVDDPRNTDNAWMETVASNFHDDGDLFYNLNLSAGDDAKCVKWMDINSKLKLYASHKNFIREVALKHNASW